MFGTVGVSDSVSDSVSVSVHTKSQYRKRLLLVTVETEKETTAGNNLSVFPLSTLLRASFGKSLCYTVRRTAPLVVVFHGERYLAIPSHR